MNYTEKLAIREYVKNNISVFVHIDFEHGHISLVEKSNQGYQRKQWLFAERQLEYMNGWLNILDAMQYAITCARDDLKAYQEAKKEAETKKMASVMNEMNKS